MRLSVIVVAHDRAADLSACLESLRAQVPSELEIIVVLNRATSAVRTIALHAEENTAHLRTLTFSGSASEARNHGVAVASGPVLYFIDDDVCVPENGIVALLEELDAHPDVAILGGPNLTPPDDPPLAQITGALLGSWWGTGIARARYSRAEPMEAHERDLILCNLAVRRSVFERGLAFPLLFGGEENVLMGHAEEEGLRLWYSPRVWVHHRRRRTLGGYLRQMYRYGWGRANAIYRAPRTSHIAYFVPVGFLGYVLCLPLLSVVTPLALVPLVVYGAGTTIASLAVCIEHGRPGWLLPLLVLYPATHLSYAAGLGSRLARWALLAGPAASRERARR